jgi:IS5 family transposase
MYKCTEKQVMIADDFFLPFQGKLNKENRWVKLAEIIPWWEFEDEYAANFQSWDKGGEVAYSIRIALGTLIIKEKEGLSDENTVQHIAENPYMQYFLGFPKFTEERPFVSSQLTHFRKRLGSDILNRVNEAIARIEIEKDDDNPPSSSGGDQEEKPGNAGKMLLDATCAPADIQYPTDTRLLNDAREKMEAIIDILHESEKGNDRKPRTYREKARKSYLQFVKQRKPKPNQVRKMKGKLLRYLRRDLKIIEKMVEKTGLQHLKKAHCKDLEVIKELYKQQVSMYEKNDRRIEDRIVSISQPHVRPIVRGKASASVEFGAKLTVSVVNGYVQMEKLKWDAYNEGKTLIEATERYKEKYGVFPEAILADKIFRTKENRLFCKENHIRLSGPKLGRTKEEEKPELKKQARLDSAERNQVEGKFGEAKRKYTLNRIMARLKETSETTIMLNLIVMNLEKRLRLLLLEFFKWVCGINYENCRVALGG